MKYISSSNVARRTPLIHITANTDQRLQVIDSSVSRPALIRQAAHAENETF